MDSSIPQGPYPPPPKIDKNTIYSPSIIQSFPFQFIRKHFMKTQQKIAKNAIVLDHSLLVRGATTSLGYMCLSINVQLPLVTR